MGKLYHSAWWTTSVAAAPGEENASRTKIVALLVTVLEYYESNKRMNIRTRLSNSINRESERNIIKILCMLHLVLLHARLHAFNFQSSISGYIALACAPRPRPRARRRDCAAAVLVRAYSTACVLVYFNINIIIMIAGTAHIAPSL